MSIAWVSPSFKKTNTTALTTITITGVTVAAGNTIMVMVGSASNTATISSVTDSAGNVYTVDAGIANSTTVWAGTARVLSALALSAGTITVTLAASATASAFVEVYSGVSAFGVVGAGSTGTSTNPNTSITTQDANNFVVGLETHRSGATVSVNQGNLRDSILVPPASTTIPGGGAMDNTAASASAVTIGDTLSASAAWACFAIELRSATGTLVIAEWDESQKWQKNTDTNVSWAASEIDTGLLPIVPNIVYGDEPSRCFDVRGSQEDEPWHTFFVVTIPPPPTLGWDDYEGHRYIDTRYASQTTEADAGVPPILPAPGWDELDWQKFWGVGYSGPTTESDLGAAPIIPGLVYDEDLSHSTDTHFASAEDEPWQTFFAIPVPPPNLGWDEWDWNRNFDTRITLHDDERSHAFFTIPIEGQWDDWDWSRNVETKMQQEDDPWHTFFLIPAPPPNQGWDDWAWSKDFSPAYVKQFDTESIEFTLPILLPVGWYDDTQQKFGMLGLSALVILDEFVNAPTGTLPGPFVGISGMRAFFGLIGNATTYSGLDEKFRAIQGLTSSFSSYEAMAASMRVVQGVSYQNVNIFSRG